MYKCSLKKKKQKTPFLKILVDFQNLKQTAGAWDSVAKSCLQTNKTLKYTQTSHHIYLPRKGKGQ